jgi:hypothetical protein
VLSRSPKRWIALYGNGKKQATLTETGSVDFFLRVCDRREGRTANRIERALGADHAGWRPPGPS